jgi:hypothetical protein
VLGADESIVVMNPRPMKAGNRPEEKTGGTPRIVAVGLGLPKAAKLAKGGRHSKYVTNQPRVGAMRR